jgi:hypothetical protein
LYTSSVDEPDAIEYVDETLGGELLAAMQEAEGTWPGGVRPNLHERIAVLHARAVYVAAESQARASFRQDASTKRLATATWILAFATVGLVFATIVLIVISATN